MGKAMKTEKGRRAIGAVKIAVHFRPFREVPALPQGHKLFPADEVVVHAIPLALARRSGGAGNGEGEPGEIRHQALDQRGLSRAGGRADDQSQA